MTSAVVRNIILALVVGSIVVVGFAYAAMILPAPIQKSTTNTLFSTSTQSTTVSIQSASTTITSSSCSSSLSSPNQPSPTNDFCDMASDGIVRGIVSVGPAQPVCTPSGCGTINMSGYSLVFVYDCASTSPCPMIAFAAPLQSNGSYSLELPAGHYDAETLSPSCSWLGCPRSFPVSFATVASEITNLNITIDTGIR